MQSYSLGEDSRRASGREETPAGPKEGRRALQRGGASAPDDSEEPARPPPAITRPTQERFPQAVGPEKNNVQHQEGTRIEVSVFISRCTYGTVYVPTVLWLGILI
jgi:hypothetical protein